MRTDTLRVTVVSNCAMLTCDVALPAPCNPATAPRPRAGRLPRRCCSPHPQAVAWFLPRRFARRDTAAPQNRTARAGSRADQRGADAPRGDRNPTVFSGKSLSRAYCDSERAGDKNGVVSYALLSHVSGLLFPQARFHNNKLYQIILKCYIFVHKFYFHL